jgi:hypothetical protein
VLQDVTHSERTWKMKTIRKLNIAFLVFALLVLLTAIVLWYPQDAGVIPDWKLQLVDHAGRPVVGVNAIQEWLDPIDEGMTPMDIQRTDSSGFVVFPKHLLHKRLEQGTLRFKPSAHVYVCGQGLFGEVFWEARDGQVPAKLELVKGPCPFA